eukprot:TRINITY_DN27_c0_g2_i6.p2 TRINITY_DN27_c0_g2~~TRINITY_DN27_c0_g2_i6.p2  ORF type:complete len:109 (+),score=5.56 TRINITY_DN27_c0_g2_i6:1008-1334(+)
MQFNIDRLYLLRARIRQTRFGQTGTEACTILMQVSPLTARLATLMCSVWVHATQQPRMRIVFALSILYAQILHSNSTFLVVWRSTTAVLSMFLCDMFYCKLTKMPSST